MPSRIAMHEAAHAVTAEVLCPGCVEYVDMAPDPATNSEWAASLGVSQVDAYVRWDASRMGTKGCGTVWYAGKWAEKILGVTYWEDHCDGDMNAAKTWLRPGIRSSCSRKSKSIVSKHWDAIVRVAELLDTRSITFGNDIREAMHA